MSEPAGLYIHIPFCRSLCHYCAFAVSVRSGLAEAQQAYMAALAKELESQMARYGSELNFRTVYIGGGTPSQLSDGCLRQLFAMLRKVPGWEQVEEVTIEANPEDLCERPHLPELLAELGVSRLCVGLQSMSDKGLRVLGRSCDAQRNAKAMELLESKWKAQLSYDLIVGWAGQSPEDLMGSERGILLDAKADHLSAYILHVEPGSVLWREERRGKAQLPGSDEQAGVWDAMLELCKQGGWQQYEISSFGRGGARGLHNRSCWRWEPYLGLGAGAVSRVGQRRWTNCRSLEGYIRRVNSGQSLEVESEELSALTMVQEELMLGLRHDEGIRESVFFKNHGLSLIQAGGECLKAWQNRGLLLEKNGQFALSQKGWMLYDDITSDWMLGVERLITGDKVHGV